VSPVDQHDQQWLVPPAAPLVPVIACLPHGGRDFPPDLAAELAIPARYLWSDWLTRELYAFLPELGVTTIATSLSRFVADVNRDPVSGHGPFWSTVVAAQTPAGRAVYRRPLTPAEIDARIALAHTPFHHALDASVAALLARFPRLLLLDLHSYGKELGGELILGDRFGATARPQAVDLVERAAVSRGLDTRRNHRFAGGWTVRRFADHPDVDAIQLELSQRRYLDLTGPRRPGPPPVGAFDATTALLRDLLQEVIAGYSGGPSSTAM
jgi:N-formylglutamate deformylase